MFAELLLMALLIIPTVSKLSDGNIQCLSSHIIAARGSHAPGEPCGGGLGNLVEIVELVKRKVPGTTSSAVNYPAAFDGACGISFNESRSRGIANLRSQIEHLVEQCGVTTDLVLLGYSQGAFVISDLISGGGSTDARALEDQYRRHLKAVVLIADPAQVQGARYNAPSGAPSGKGVYHTSNPSKLASLGPKRIVAYCSRGDEYCDPAHYQPGNFVHEAEESTWAQDAVRFIVDRILPK